MIGSLHFYMMDHEYNILEIKVIRCFARTLSTTEKMCTRYKATVGKVWASTSVMMVPDALQVNVSI